MNQENNNEAEAGDESDGHRNFFSSSSLLSNNDGSTFITRDMIRRERLLKAILHESRSTFIAEGRSRVIIEAEERRDFGRLSAGVRKLAYVAALGTSGTTIEIEEQESICRKSIFEQEPLYWEQVLSQVDPSLDEAYARSENRQIAYQTLKEVLFNEEDVALCDIYHEQYDEHHEIYSQIAESARISLMSGQWRIERREECDLRWEMEEKEQEEFDILISSFEDLVVQTNGKKFSVFEKKWWNYKISFEEREIRENLENFQQIEERILIEREKEKDVEKIRLEEERIKQEKQKAEEEELRLLQERDKTRRRRKSCISALATGINDVVLSPLSSSSASSCGFSFSMLNQVVELKETESGTIIDPTEEKENLKQQIILQQQNEEAEREQKKEKEKEREELLLQHQQEQQQQEHNISPKKEEDEKEVNEISPIKTATTITNNNNIAEQQKNVSSTTVNLLSLKDFQQMNLLKDVVVHVPSNHHQSLLSSSQLSPQSVFKQQIEDAWSSLG